MHPAFPQSICDWCSRCPPDGPLVLSQKSDSGLGWHEGKLPNPPTRLLSTGLGGTVCTPTLLSISLSPLRDGGELHSSGAVAVRTPVVFPKC